MPEISDAEFRAFARYQNLGSPDDLEKTLRRVEKTEEEAKGVRERIKELEGKLPPEGAVVLAGDDAAAWGVYRELGKPDEVKSGLEERKVLAAEKAARTRADARTAAAKALGWDPDVFAGVAGVDTLELELRTERRKGPRGEEDASVPYVKGEDGKMRPLADHAKEKFPPAILNVLPAKATPSGDASRPAGGRTFLASMGAGEPRAGGDTLAERREEKRRSGDYTL